METKQLDDLHENPNNPRTLSNHDGNALATSLKEFGDLSGIVYNVRTDRLVGGHQRAKTFKKLGGKSSVVITQRFAEPNSVGTTAVGYLTYNGEFYAYREVDWDEPREMSANVAANRISGDWEFEKLSNVNTFLEQAGGDYLRLTGQTNEEINKLKNLGSEPEQQTPDDGFIHLSFQLTKEQAVFVQEALDNIKAGDWFIPDEQNISIEGNALAGLARKHLEEFSADSNQEPQTDPEVPQNPSATI